jgi:mRNA interferase RelE/StbE
VTWQIEIKRSARKALLALPSTMRRRLGERIDALADEPRPPGARKLAGSDIQYRIRVGDYRILYEIHDNRLVINVIKIGHRREVYR